MSADRPLNRRKPLVVMMVIAIIGMVTVALLNVFTDLDLRGGTWYVGFAMPMVVLPASGLLAYHWRHRDERILDFHRRLLIGVLELLLLVAAITIGPCLLFLTGAPEPWSPVIALWGCTLVAWTNTYYADDGAAVRLVVQALRPDPPAGSDASYDE